MLKHKAEYKHSKRKTRRKKKLFGFLVSLHVITVNSQTFSREGGKTQVENHTSAFLSSRPWFFKFVVRQWLLAITTKNIQNSQGKIRMQNFDLHLKPASLFKCLQEK